MSADDLLARARQARLAAEPGIGLRGLRATRPLPAPDLSVSELIGYRTALRDMQATIHTIADRVGFNVSNDLDQTVAVMIGTINEQIGALT